VRALALSRCCAWRSQTI